ncbi:uncharacterized protein LOC127734718 isoform X2 [Mytilus californianus]|uniref:uncharacterized protein LOC127734718 isoform X2 n=1 Tax=Mytilus californianus TaxID=6549 RepID=UPI00224872F5|nr:uncharacterized protein LOC127734718 isoform X2 [Mytilus californianus]
MYVELIVKIYRESDMQLLSPCSCMCLLIVYTVGKVQKPSSRSRPVANQNSNTDLEHLSQVADYIVNQATCMRGYDSSIIPELIYKVNNQTIQGNNSKVCTDNETLTSSCLNGGSCFAVDKGDRIVRCACYTGYIGKRCERIDPSITFKSFEKKEAINGRLIPGITALVAFILIVVLMVVYIRRIDKNYSGDQPETTKMIGNTSTKSMMIRKR